MKISTVMIGALCMFAFSSDAFAIGQARYVAGVASPGSFAIAQGKAAATLYVDSSDWPGVVRAVNDLQADIERVTGIESTVSNDAKTLKTSAIIVGTVGKSPIIDRLIQDKKIDVTAIEGKWESFFLHPMSVRFRCCSNTAAVMEPACRLY